MNIINVAYDWAKPLSKRSETNIIVLHHAKARNCTVSDIHQWHLQNGWAGFAYHAFVRKDGSIYAGRPFDCVGAHVEGHNYDSIGICFEGDFEEEFMGEKQIQSGVDIIKYIRTQYGNIPVVGHRDVGKSSCPGKLFPMEEIQKRIGVKELNLDEALQLLFDKGIINNPTYWKTGCTYFKFLDSLIISFAQYAKK